MAGSWSQSPHVSDYYRSVRSFYLCSERVVFISSLLWFPPFKRWVIRFSKWVSNLRQKFWKVLFLFCISRNRTHLHPPQFYLWGGLLPSEKKVFLLTSVRHSPFCAAPWAQTDTEQISKHTCAHKLFCFILQLSVMFFTLIQKRPRLKIHLEVSMSLEQIIHWQNEAYSKPRNTNASSLPSFCPIQCSVLGV